MYRFFCTECKKVKRVQRIPKRISNSSSVNPTDRIGRCNKHSPFSKEQAEGHFNRAVSKVTLINS